MSEYANLGIFDKVKYVKPGPLSSMDENGIAVPSTVEIFLSNDSTSVQIVVTSEVARGLARLLKAHARG